MNAFIKARTYHNSERNLFTPRKGSAQGLPCGSTVGVIPVINPIATSTGEYIAQIPVQKGQLVTLGVACYQRLVAPLVDKSGSIYVYA
jgi:hypothetical protein